MAVEYTLLMQKTADGSAVKSSLDDFGFAVCDIPWPDEETEEVLAKGNGVASDPYKPIKQ